MQNFIIERLRVSGTGKIDGVINFTDGLNIVRGRSNTGKTWILKCIYYLFSSDSTPFSPLTGYTDIEGIFLTKRYGRVTITRKLGEEFAYVSSESNELEDGNYDTNYKKENTRYLNDVWLRIIGLENTIKVPSSSRYARERISWTNIASVFIADENEIDKSDSIVIKDSYSETALVATLFYLLTGDYKEEFSEIPKPEVATATKKAMVAYIDEQVSALTEKRVGYIMQLEELQGRDIDSEVQELTEGIDALQNEINELIEENAAIAKQITTTQQEEAHCDVLVDRYKSLISQYKADLQRLDFLAKGEKAVKELASNGICPFCGGEFKSEKDELYNEAVNAEIRRIVSEITVIAATESGVIEEREAIIKRIEELKIQRENVNNCIAEKNQAIRDCKLNLQRFKDYTTLQTGIDFVNEQLAILGQRKVSELAKKKNPPLYHAKKEFQELVGFEFDLILNQILQECNYRAGGYASWDFKTFDILMDGVPKSEDQGKGYRSFLNSVVALMLYEVFNGEGVFIKPGILMIDTPLLGFDEDEEAFSGSTIKKGLYEYFVNHPGNGQVIIVDNLNVMPEMDFEAKGINVVTYHKDEKDGHIYGFMPSWRKDLPKE